MKNTIDGEVPWPPRFAHQSRREHLAEFTFPEQLVRDNHVVFGDLNLGKLALPPCAASFRPGFWRGVAGGPLAKYNGTETFSPISKIQRKVTFDMCALEGSAPYHTFAGLLKYGG